MQIEKTKLRDVWLVKPDVYTDFRGDYVMTFNKKLYEQFGFEVVEQDISTSTKGVLRGIHYSPNCWKIYECMSGTMYYAIVNCDKEDPEFGRWESFIISDKNHCQIVKHPRYGAGFVAVTDCVLHYMQSEYYNPDDPNQSTFKYNDERFKIWWPKITPEPILSRRDEIGEYEFRLKEAKC